MEEEEEVNRSIDESDKLRGERQERAAKVLQAQFRKYRSERENAGLSISSGARWHEAIKNQRRRSAHIQSGHEAKNDSHSRWQRAGLFATELVDRSSSQSSSLPNSPALDQSSPNSNRPSLYQQKTMDVRYWLEMVDQKHRYGANLKAYHAFWNSNYSGDQNFFYWLDHGDGKELDLKDSPRDRLESEKIIYLNIEQRRNYLVKINEEGKLIWVKDGRPVDTARGKHKDLGNGLGIVDAAEEDFEEARKRGEIPSSDSDLYSTDSSYEADPRHYSVQKPSKSKLAAKIKSRIHPKHMMDHLLRKTLSVNTWIFVADKNGNLYVGIKHPGKFQHSSFLAGSHVLAAGLLKVREGQLTSLSPLSGHYRGNSESFKRFVNILEHEWGCDMSKVSISTSLIIIGALEKYGTLTKKKHELEDKIKNLLSISKPSKGEDSDGEKSKDQRRESEAEGRRTEELIRLERTRLKEEYQKNSRINKIAERSGDEERKRILKSIRLDSGGGDDEEGDDKKDSVVSTTSGCRGEVRKLVIDHCDGHHHHHELLRKAFLSDLPHDGKKIEEMTDDQRIERGAALIARAMSRPLRKSP